MICRSSVSRFSFSSIVVKRALCVARILVVSLAFSFICSIVFSKFSMRVVTVPSVDATPVVVAMASVLKLIDFSLLILTASRRHWTFKGMDDSRRVLSVERFVA